MSDINKPSDNVSESAPKPTRKMPDLSLCRVSHTGIGDLVYCCALADSKDCAYAEHHAFETYCFHPKWNEILARPKANL